MDTDMDMDIGFVHEMEGIGYIQSVEEECIHCQLDEYARCHHPDFTPDSMATTITILCNQATSVQSSSPSKFMIDTPCII
ncbi:predicted protein [Lichtheimia corymbifera JMRC:FSU:9682]|uniref:Uncharacterized protein n=1 Tax=Lichtheimia corymbifera JMRC:FSU:9682 TaxID=1263082 RepID=A0A068S1R7_9FUNG|nr:predicted protein [Lichtheimia corymbifera JMRC:FSU:9682]